MAHLIEFGLFFGKVVIIFLAIAGILLLLFALALRSKLKPDFQVEDINEKLSQFEEHLGSIILNKKEQKAIQRAEKERHKAAARGQSRKIYVLDFKGDMEASHVKELSDEITAVLTIAKPGDEAVICVESPGGTVHGYGLGAAEILRLKNAGIKVTVCVDKVAASGGYMMACTADKIIAAPFAILGSIGVLAMVPNVHRLLKKYDVDYEEISAGEYKRTVSMLGEITDKGRAKFREQIEDTHTLFKNFVNSHRPQVDMSKVATGEYWFGVRALELKLVDELATSDEYLFAQRQSARIFGIRILPKKKIGEKLQDMIGKTTTQVVDRLLQNRQF